MERASRHFGRVIVAVLANPSKAPLFDVEERVGLLKMSLAHLTNLEIDHYEACWWTSPGCGG